MTPFAIGGLSLLGAAAATILAAQAMAVAKDRRKSKKEDKRK